jgi:hypothetical protein
MLLVRLPLGELWRGYGGGGISIANWIKVSCSHVQLDSMLLIMKSFPLPLPVTT